MRVAFQGERGAHSQRAALSYFGEEVVTVPCSNLDKVFNAVEQGEAEYGIVPIENSYAGTIVATMDLLERYDLFIIGETSTKIRHALLGVPGTKAEDVRRVYSHPQALEQCEGFLRESGFESVPALDTAGAAREVSERGIREEAAVAHVSCAKIYGLRVLRRSIQTWKNNATRFLILGTKPVQASGLVKTSLVFETRHIPSALFKALGGFATNGVNLTKIESRPSKKRPLHYAFHLDFEGAPEERAVQNALRELRFFSKRVRIFGTYAKATGNGRWEGDGSLIEGDAG